MIKHKYNVYGICQIEGSLFSGTCVSDDIVKAIKMFRENGYSIWNIERKEQVRNDEQIGSNIGFIADQFNEQMDKTVMEAKGEIESFCQNNINAIASAALVEHRDEILQLENPVDIESE